MITAKRAALLVAGHVGLHDPPRETLKVLVEVLMIEGATPSSAAEHAESLLPGVTSHLIAAENELVNDGQNCSHTFCSVGTHLIQGAGHPDPGIEESVTRARLTRGSAADCLDYLRSLTAREFEQLCRGVLSILGCADAQVTTRSRDQGIDFFGHLSLTNRLDNNGTLPSLDQKLGVWIAGQAKHRPNSATSTDEIRHIIGSVAMARSGVFARGGETLQGFMPRFVDPVVVAIITSGTFSRDSWDLINRAGLIALDGHRLAVFLCDNGVGIQTAAPFNPVLAGEWLANHAPTEGSP